MGKQVGGEERNPDLTDGLKQQLQRASREGAAQFCRHFTGYCKPQTPTNTAHL